MDNVVIHCHYIFWINVGAEKAIEGTDKDAVPGKLPSDKDGSIILPGSLFEQLDDQQETGAFFGIYNSTTLFPVGGGKTAVDRLTQTGSYVITATVGDDSVKINNLREPVTVTLRLQLNETVSESVNILCIIIIHVYHYAIGHCCARLREMCYMGFQSKRLDTTRLHNKD